MQIRHDTVIKDKLPERIARLEELAYNFWWSWNRSARDLFKMLDRMLWGSTRHNPVMMLREVRPERLEALAKDPVFLRQYDAVMMEFDRALTGQGTWFQRMYPQHMEDTIAYFSAEFGLHTSLPIYSGGLGVLSGDHLKEASDLGLPFTAVGFLYELGYFRQHLNGSGWQEAIYPPLSPENAALQPELCDDHSCRIISLEVGDRRVHLQIWRVKVGRVTLYLMDADVPENAPWDRELTARLYGGDQEMRIQQEILLGIGGVRILRALGIEPKVWHINEGHSAFLVLERMRELVEKGVPYAEAMEQVRATTIFTTHTPVPAGHDVFPYHLMEKYFHNFWPRLGLSRDDFMALGYSERSHAPGFNMTALALRFSKRANGVSRLHGEVSREMWQCIYPQAKTVDEVPIGHVTNGVHVPSWVGETMHSLYRKYLAPDWMQRQDDPAVWERIEDVPDATLWQAHIELKRKMFSTIRERARQGRVTRSASPEQLLASGIFLDPDALVIGFARRFATYKRANLIFRDIERLLRLLHDRDRPVQLVFAGKAHPADDPGKRLLQEIYHWALSPEVGGRVAFIEDYDMHVARYLVQGVDVWLNTPRKPMEASGTSGMKAAINGVLNLSIPDGWWAEGYNGRNGWSIDAGDYPTPEEQDAADAALLYQLIEEEVAPLFYQRDRDNIPRGWVAMMKESIRTAGARFSTCRMVQDYTRDYYVPALQESEIK